MAAVDGEFVCGGYFLYAPQPWTREPGFERGPNCLWEGAAFFPDPWAIAWAGGELANDPRAEAAAFGVPPGDVDALVARVTALFDEQAFLWPNVLPDLAAARRFAAMLPRLDALRLIGVAFPAEDVEALIRFMTPPPQPGFAPTSAGGVCDMLSARRPLEAGFTELGYDGVDVAGGLVSDGLSDLQRPWFEESYGPRNAEGLCPSLENARRAAAALTESDVVGTPRTYWPARIVRYAL